MTIGLRANHISVYYDEAFSRFESLPDSQEGGWCVEFSDSEMTWRFRTFETAMNFVGGYEKWLRTKAHIG